MKKATKVKKTLSLKEKNKRVLARLLSIDVSFFYDLEKKEGFPLMDKNGAYNVIQVMKWYITYQREKYKNQKSTYQDYKIRIYAAQAKKAELELEFMQRESCSTDYFKEQILRFLSKLKSDLFDIPGKLAWQIENKPGHFIKSMLEKSLVMALNETVENIDKVFMDEEKHEKKKKSDTEEFLEELEEDDELEEFEKLEKIED